jgi:hypothetical protein
MAAETNSGTCSTSNRELKQPGKAWLPPAEGEIKINVDAAFQPSSGEAFIGVVARDHHGNT